MGSLVINHNTSALNTQRNLKIVDKQTKTTLEHLSSGERIVRAADGPATLMISEQMRAQIASVAQAIRNSETSVSMIQTTEAALNEVNRLLINIRQLSIHAANEGANDENMLNADQQEIDNSIGSIDRVSQFAQFGTKKLLDGSNGVNGVAAGEGLSFIKATEMTKTSPDAGYEVKVTQGATKTQLVADQPLTKEVIDSEVELTVSEGGRVASYKTKPGDDPRVVRRQLQNAIDVNGIQMDVEVLEGFDDPTIDGRLVLTHKEFGSKPKFSVVSTVPGVLAKSVDRPDVIQTGMDVQGTINGQLAYGDGQYLTAAEGTDPEGLEIRYSGGTPQDAQEPVGRVQVSQNSLIFQIGPNAGQRVAVSLESVSTRTLGSNVPNESKFRFLSDVDVTNAQGAQDAMRLVDKAIDDVNVVRASLGAVQKNSMEANIRTLGITHEELISSESVLRDADMAEEISNLTRNQIIMQSGIAMLGQANQASKNVLSLVKNA